MRRVVVRRCFAQQYRPIFLVEALAVLFSITIYFCAWQSLTAGQIRNQRAQLRRLEMQHLVSLIWYRELQPRQMLTHGIHWNAFDRRDARICVPLPAERAILPGGRQCHAHIIFTHLEQSPKRSSLAKKRLICAQLHLKLGLERFESAQWLIFQREGVL